VSCPSAADCWAVDGAPGQGTSASTPLIDHYDGSAWSVASSPSTPAGSVLSAITCVSATDCWAVGDGDDTGTGSTSAVGAGKPALIEHCDGVAWTIVDSPADSQGQITLGAITCVSATDCWAVGEYSEAELTGLPVIEHYDGSVWSFGGGPGVLVEALQGVGCTGPNECVAVGSPDLSLPTPTPGTGT